MIFLNFLWLIMVKMLVNIVVMILVNVWLRLGFGLMILAVVEGLN